MAEVRYKGQPKISFRSFSPADFAAMGFEDHEEVQWWGGGDTSELSDEVAKVIVERHPNEFELVDDENKPVTEDEVAKLERQAAEAREKLQAQSAKDREGAEAAEVKEREELDRIRDGQPQSEEALDARDAGSPPATGDASPSPGAGTASRRTSGTSRP